MRVLVVDDDFDSRFICRYALEIEGHTVLEAGCGMTALQMALVCAPDLIVLDIMLPALDGIRVLRELRKRPKTKNLPVIVVSAKVTREDRLAGWKAGADEYLTKPYDPHELILCVDRVANLDSSQRQIARAMARSGLATSFPKS